MRFNELRSEDNARISALIEEIAALVAHVARYGRPLPELRDQLLADVDEALRNGPT